MDRDEARALLGRKFVLFTVEGTAEAAIVESLINHDALVVPFGRLVSDHDDPDRYYTRTRKARDIADRYFNANYHYGGAEGLLIARVVDTSKGVLGRLLRPYEGDQGACTNLEPCPR